MRAREFIKTRHPHDTDQIGAGDTSSQMHREMALEKLHLKMADRQST